MFSKYLIPACAIWPHPQCFFLGPALAYQIPFGLIGVSWSRFDLGPALTYQFPFGLIGASWSLLFFLGFHLRVLFFHVSSFISLLFLSHTLSFFYVLLVFASAILLVVLAYHFIYLGEDPLSPVGSVNHVWVV